MTKPKAKRGADERGKAAIIVKAQSLHGTQARLNILQDLPVGKLCEGHIEKLTNARKGSHIMITMVLIQGPV